jgi:hypothetical protein
MTNLNIKRDIMDQRHMAKMKMISQRFKKKKVEIEHASLK